LVELPCSPFKDEFNTSTFFIMSPKKTEVVQLL